MILVHKSKVAEYYHRWYIDYGYRKVASWRDALYSLFKIHNETMNIWSHLIGLICVVIAAANLSYDFYDSAYSSFSELLAVESYFISAAICMLLSTLFHWFGCVNESCYEVLLRLDLTGVALLVTGSYVPAVYYGFQCAPSLQQFYSVYAGMVLLVGLAAPWLPVNPTIRPYVLASTVAGGLVPAAHWVLITPAVYRDSLLPYFAGMFFWYFVGFGFFATHIPERYYPNSFWFAIIFSSHTLWHISVLNAIYVWFYFLIHYRTLLEAHQCVSYEGR